jgi:hypothetical protein
MSCKAPLFRASTGGLECGLRALLYAVAVVVLALFIWIPAIRCLLLKRRFMVWFCQEGNDDPTIDLEYDPKKWLAAHPAAAAALVWEKPGGALHPYSAWSAAERKALFDAFWRARMKLDFGVDEAPADSTPQAANQLKGTWFPTDRAWRLFVIHVAQVLAVEDAGWVPWSITGYAPAQLSALLDSRQLFQWDAKASRYRVQNWISGSVTPGDPVRAFRFLRDGGILGADSRETVEALIQWCHDHMEHFKGDTQPANCTDHWQYAGYPPLQRIIGGTTRTSDGAFRHFTAGCHGTVGFLKTALRTANLTVEQLIECGHSQAHFLEDDLYLGHGDDPYSRLIYFHPPRPAGEVLIDAATFAAWFGPAVPDDQACKNVSRQGVELAILYPSSDYLLGQRCWDQKNGNTKAESEVYKVFQAYYTVAELDAKTLWQRIDAELFKRGGCGAIPPG